LATVKADEQGFNASLTQLEAGDKISAIATVPKYVLSNRLKRYYPFSQCSKTNPKSKTGGWKKFLLVPRFYLGTINKNYGIGTIRNNRSITLLALRPPAGIRR
jgi:hypothetical protein